MDSSPDDNKMEYFLKILPVASLTLLVIVSMYILTIPGFGMLSSASAQVDLGRVGDSIVEQVAGAQAESSENVAEAMSAGDPASGSEMSPSELLEGLDIESLSTGFPEGLLENMEDLEALMALLDEEMPPTDASDIGGKSITELTEEELKIGLAEIEIIGPFLAPALMPIMTRFQTMVKPPVNVDELPDGFVPWWMPENARRYSPFDIVGQRPPPPPSSRNISPPWPNPDPAAPPGGDDGVVLTAAEVASAMRLKGVMGSAGSYSAIAISPLGENTYSVGEEVFKDEDSRFIVEEITFDTMKIVNEARPLTDVGFVTFGQRDSISGFSISY